MASTYDISSEQSKRLNIMKFLLSIFVVYIHAKVGEISLQSGRVVFELPKWFTYFSYVFSEVIPACAVSGFYFMSSLLLYKKEFKWGNNIKKRIKNILIPYFLMNTFWIAIFAVCQNIPFTRGFFGDENKLVANFTLNRWLEVYGIGSLYPLLYPLWFLRNLFVLSICACLIKKIIDLLPKLSLIAICYIFLFVSAFPFGDFFYLLKPLDLCMWCLGYFCVKFNWNLNKFDRSKPFFVAFVFLFVLRMITMDKDLGLASLLLYRISILVNLIFWYSWFTSNINGRIQRMFLDLSIYSFGIFIFHELSLTFGMKIIAKIIGMDYRIQILEYLFLPSIIIAVVIGFCKIFRKVVPSLYSLLVGDRVNKKQH